MLYRDIAPHGSEFVKVLRRCGLPQRRSSERSKTNHYPRKKITGTFDIRFVHNMHILY